MIPVNVLNSGQTTRGGPPAWSLGDGPKTPHPEKGASYEMLHRASGALF